MQRVVKDGQDTVVLVSVENTGNREGEDAVCLYVKSPPGAGDRRRCHLEGVSKVRLRPLQSVVLTFRLPPRAFEVYREDGSTFVPEGGEVLVGGDGPPM